MGIDDINMGEGALPSFLQREELKDQNNDVPVAFLVISTLVVIGAVAYAVRYLHREQAEDAQRKNDQAQKRAAKKAKKGQKLTPDDVVDDDDAAAAPLQAVKQAGSFVFSLIRDVLIVGILLVVLVEGWRWLPRVTVVPCSDVLGRADDGSKCVANRPDTWWPRYATTLTPPCSHPSPLPAHTLPCTCAHPSLSERA